MKIYYLRKYINNGYLASTYNKEKILSVREKNAYFLVKWSCDLIFYRRLLLFSTISTWAFSRN